MSHIGIPMIRSSPRHLYLLDILRGLASLSVIVWHYQNFFLSAPGELSRDFVTSRQPLYVVLWPLYNYGYRAVQLFFVLSGFVFYLIYCQKIKTHSVSCYEFALLRFSRLYPLYFVTLIYVAIIQSMAHSTLGSFIVYPFNDLRHFLLNLFFASDWGLQCGDSFNAPAWSVSVEILLYAVFFIVAVIAGKNVLVPGILMPAGYWMATHGMSDIGWGLYCFFAGGIAFFVYDRCSREPIARRRTLLIQAGTLVLGVIGIYGCSRVRFSSGTVKTLLLCGVCFPSAVLSLATFQNYKHEAGKSIKLIGDITYASYLMHFPVQLSMIWITRYRGIALDYYSATWLIMFLGIVILISVPTYYFFELPAQLFFRRHFKLVASAT